MIPETARARLAEIRERVLRRESSDEELIEAIRLLREARAAAAVGTTAPAPAADPEVGRKLLDQLMEKR